MTFHAERYIVHPKFIDEEQSAWKSLGLEPAHLLQRMLKREGVETELA